MLNLLFFFPLIEPFGLLFGIDFTCGQQQGQDGKRQVNGQEFSGIPKSVI